MSSRKSKEAANILCFAFELFFDLIVITWAYFSKHK